MSISTKERSNAPEIMDDFAMEGPILGDALDKIAKINQLLGGNKVTLEGINFLLKGQPAGSVIRILDIGCGNGDMLRFLADYGKRHGLSFLLTGIDANNYTVEHAKRLSLNYPAIQFECLDIFNSDDQLGTYDILLCTLTLHHFKDDEIISLLATFKKRVKLGMVINDLHRSALAYHLFRALCFVFRLNDMSREDGLVSILRGFKKADLVRYSRQLNLPFFAVNWKWAFRYQWIIKT